MKLLFAATLVALASATANQAQNYGYAEAYPSAPTNTTPTANIPTPGGFDYGAATNCDAKYEACRALPGASPETCSSSKAACESCKTGDSSCRVGPNANMAYCSSQLVACVASAFGEKSGTGPNNTGSFPTGVLPPPNNNTVPGVGVPPAPTTPTTPPPTTYTGGAVAQAASYGGLAAAALAAAGILV
ncbi:hypothetical protein GTA08_BOTSDO04334 [Botryosphaeria dothidea]|uniref:Uncharacterized protein n=1 Tax=Botryosphaeria dothidea TaxID=55169 RepID=A0A8H4IUY9_9PEZI|nr:hypothetical protein GTA08_BOTSDO04334 [Botryosphaeria dothidea]